MSEGEPKHASERGGVDRRTFLIEPSLLVGAVAVVGGLPGAALAQPGSADFAWLAVFLTGKPDLPEAMVGRALAAMRDADAGIDARLAALAERIRGAGLADVEAFRASPITDDKPLMATAVLVIRALYTGRVGSGPTARYVGFEDALMFRPTRDATVVPTFSRWSPDYWVEAPK